MSDPNLHHLEPRTTTLANSPARARRRYVLAVGGGRGGVGKTLLSVNLAVYLAQLGRNVVLCDADPVGSNLHTMLALNEPPMALPAALRAGDFELAQSSVPGLSLMPVAYDPWRVGPRRASRKAHWMAPLANVEADYLVLNLGASTSPATLDVFFEADISICVTAPEPPAIEATYSFCRALFVRRLRRLLMRERFALRAVERALAAMPPHPTPRELIAKLLLLDERVANRAASVLAQVRPSLVVGKTRLKSDLELGPAMAALSERFLGTALDYLGYVEQDDAVWLTARRRRPLLIDAPTSKAARNVERVARRILALLAQPKRAVLDATTVQASKLNAPLTLYHVLGIDRSASDDEIRRAYKRQRNIFGEDALPIVSLVDDAGIKREQALILEAYDTLLEPQRRRAYNLSVFPDDEPEEPDPKSRRSEADEAELVRQQAALAREIGTETVFTGELLRRARLALGIEISDIANITKISPIHLRAIELEDLQALPASVYVRGFLREVAKALELDPTQVTKTYMKRVRRIRPQRS
ncbi:MAG TPA: hypothetical protein ENK23_01915 [Sorangium sp.]|nr:hypothetical protein [Sorangium sp.]